MDLAQISDRLEIEALLTRYTRAIDTGEWDRLDDVFTPDAADRLHRVGRHRGAVRRDEAVARRDAADLPETGCTSSARSTARSTATTATVAAYFHNPMVLPQDEAEGLLVEFGGIYHHELVRTPDGWRSRRLLEEIVWKRGL